jgi:hypothetical protein
MSLLIYKTEGPRHVAENADAKLRLAKCVPIPPVIGRIWGAESDVFHIVSDDSQGSRVDLAIGGVGHFPGDCTRGQQT